MGNITWSFGVLALFIVLSLGMVRFFGGPLEPWLMELTLMSLVPSIIMACLAAGKNRVSLVDTFCGCPNWAIGLGLALMATTLALNFRHDRWSWNEMKAISHQAETLLGVFTVHYFTACTGYSNR